MSRTHSTNPYIAPTKIIAANDMLISTHLRLAGVVISIHTSTSDAMYL